MKSFTRIAAALALSALGAAALAAPLTYEIDSTHTFPRFSYSHFGLSTQLSRFDNTRGKVVFDPQAQSGSVDIVIDMASVNTGFADFNGHLRGEDFLDTGRFPTATFRSSKVNFEGGKPRTIDGDLTIKGITRPVTLEVTSFTATQHPMMKKPVIGANAFTTIKRSQFNAGKFAPHVGDEVRIDIALEALAN